MTGPFVGRSVPRVEDDRLLRGAGRYVDDIPLPGVLQVALVRSSLGHARITRVDTSAARDMPGVVCVLDGFELAKDVPLIELAIARATPESVRQAYEVELRTHGLPVLATDIVNYMGQPVAAVLATDRYLAEDAAEAVEVEYEPLPVVVDAEAALGAGATQLEPSWPDNVAVRLNVTKGDVDAAFATAPVVISERLVSHRCAAAPMETRGIAAVPDAATGSLTVWSSTQLPHQDRDLLVGMLGLDPASVRVIAPDVGGGFGPKGASYPENILIPYLALRLGRSVKWIEDRSEHMLGTAHGRAQVHHIELAADTAGRILGVRDDIVLDVGAYSLYGPLIPLNTATHLLGPYVVETARLQVRAVLTNTMYTAPYRGAGRPEAAFAMERMIDRLAARLGMDALDVRRRNLVPAAAMPYDTGLLYRDGAPAVYDSGDYPELLERAAALAGHDEIRRLQAAEPDRLRGIGYAAYVEGTGVGPFESAAVTVEPTGTVRVAVGSSSQGQGHRTTLAQIAADAFGIDMDRVVVAEGDTAVTPTGFGTIASRSLVVGGNAVARAAHAVIRQALEYAADLLEASVEDLELRSGAVRVRGQSAPVLPLQDIAAALSPWNPGRPPGAAAALRAEEHYRPPTVTWASAVHAVLLEIDPDTGQLSLERYVVVHDAGRLINPVIVDGQITGGVAQGIGAALGEQIVYSDDGQLLTGSFMDYLVPTVAQMPEFVLDHIESPSPLNALGVKGLGEGGAIGPFAAIANAVEDALRGYGAVVRHGPLTPSRIRELIRLGGPSNEPAPNNPCHFLWNEYSKQILGRDAL